MALQRLPLNWARRFSASPGTTVPLMATSTAAAAWSLNPCPSDHYANCRCCDPLRIFLSREGLVRFCTERYEQPAAANLGNCYAHLTNYSLNKHNPAFVFNQ